MSIEMVLLIFDRVVRVRFRAGPLELRGLFKQLLIETEGWRIKPAYISSNS